MVDFDGKNIEDVIAEQGEVIASTSGVSMAPMLRNRQDMVIISKINGPLHKHDVPLYRMPSGKLLLHRIIKITRDGKYIIRGDNRYNKERNITDDNIIGVLKAFYRNGKFFDCKTSRKYKIYVFFMRLSYPFRFLFLHCLRPALGKAKRRVLTGLKKK